MFTVRLKFLIVRHKRDDHQQLPIDGSMKTKVAEIRETGLNQSV